MSVYFLDGHQANLKKQFKRLAMKHGPKDLTNVTFEHIVHINNFGLFHKSLEDFKSKKNFNPLDTKIIAKFDVIST